MRIIIQKVLRASVTVAEKVISSIGPGLVCLVGIENGDSEIESGFSIGKIIKMKLWDDDKGKAWQRDVVSMGYQVMCVSNFTLYAHFRKPRPDYHRSMDPDGARAVFEEFVTEFKKQYKPEKVEQGEFQAYMNVELVNDGPVTIMFDTAEYQGSIDTLKEAKEKRSKFKLTKDPKEKKTPKSTPSSTPSETPKDDATPKETETPKEALKEEETNKEKEKENPKSDETRVEETTATTTTA